MADVRLSVIIPGYNTSKELWIRCLESVISATGPADEIICIDDGSAQKPEFLYDLAREHATIRVRMLEKNVGLPGARNAGLDVARGEFVTFVDSDDAVFKDVYERALARLEMDNSDIAIWGVRTVWDGLNLYKEDQVDEGFYGTLSPVMVKKLYLGSVLNYAWNKVYRTRFIAQHSLGFISEGVPCEDVIFSLACICCGAKWSGCNYIGITYYRSTNSLLSTYKKTYAEGVGLCTRAWREYKESTAGAEEVLGRLGEVSESALLHGRWDNLWRKKSPYSIKAKWNFLKKNGELTKFPLSIYFVVYALLMFVRGRIYVKMLRRYRIRKAFRGVKEL